MAGPQVYLDTLPLTAALPANSTGISKLSGLGTYALFTVIVPSGGSVTFTLLGTTNGTNYSNQGCYDMSSWQIIPGGTSITVGSATNKTYLIPNSAFFSGFYVNVTANSTTGTISWQNTSVVGEQLPLVSSGTVSSLSSAGSILSSSATGGVGYTTGAGGAVTQLTNRTTGVTLNDVTGAITLFGAAGSATPATFTVTNSSVAAADTVVISQKSGTDAYTATVSAVAAGSFKVTIVDLTGTTNESPVFNFAVVKGSAS